jgi:hypothetical protein
MIKKNFHLPFIKAGARKREAEKISDGQVLFSE